MDISAVETSDLALWRLLSETLVPFNQYHHVSWKWINWFRGCNVRELEL